MQCKQNDNPKLQVEQRSRDVNQIISKRHFPKWQPSQGIFPSGNLPRVFSQAATSQGYFPKR